MARVSKAKAADPDKQIAQLEQKRNELGKRRYELGDVEKAQQRMVDGASERRLAVRLAVARGQSPPETVEGVEAERHRAEMQLVAAREEREALQAVEREIAEEIEGVEASNPAHFKARLIAQGEATLQQLAEALQIVQGVEPAWRETAKQVTRYRIGCDRRGVDKPSELPISDMGATVNEIAKAKGTLERFLERATAQEAPAQAPPGARLSNREAAARFEVIT